MSEEDFSKKRDLVKSRRKSLDKAKQNLQEWRDTAIEGKTSGGVLEYQMIRSRLADYKKDFHLGEKELFDFLSERRKQRGEFVRVLDYGCGSGQALRDLYEENVAAGQGLLPLELVGVSVGDARTEDEKRADAGMRITYVNKQYATYTPEPNSYDVIVSRWTFDHLADPLRELRKLYNALKPGGKLYLNMTINKLAEKFMTVPKEQEDDKKKMKALDDALECIRILRAYLSIDQNFTITKTDAAMEFPNIAWVTPVDDETGRGIYRLVESSDK